MFNWIILNLIGFTPVWVWPCVIGASGTAYLIFSTLTNVPGFAHYRYVLLPSSAAVCLASVFMWGGEGVAAIYQADIKTLENKVKLAEEKSRSVNTEIKTVIQYKTLIVTKFKEDLNKRIQDNKTAINDSCKLSDSAIMYYNQSVLGSQLGVTK